MSLAVAQVMWSYGTPAHDGPVIEVDAGLVVPDLVAISCQDTGILGSQGQRLNTAEFAWVELDGADGRSLDFLASGELVWAINNTLGFRVSAWNGAGFDPARTTGSRPCASGDGDPILAAVRHARFRSEEGDRLWAYSLERISPKQQALWGLFSPDGHANWEWKSIKWPVGLYSSLSSATGRTLFLASAGGVDRFNIETGTWTSLTVAGAPPPWDFVHVVAISDRSACAIYNKNGVGYLVLFAPSSGRAATLTDFVDLQPGFAGSPEFQGLAIDPSSNLLRIWIATKAYDGQPSRVYETQDSGGTWRELAGLPPVMASSVALGPQISERERYLYLGTWGRGVFQLNIA